MSCSNCGFENPENFAFCGHCGSPISPNHRTHPSEGSASEGGYLSRAERRHLSVMFIDLVGSTALSGSLDPEEMNDLMQEYRRVCADVIRQYGGQIGQY